MTQIRHARPGDAARLREVTFASKAHWGYDEARVRAWVDSLDFSEDRMTGAEMFVGDVGGRAVGWAEVRGPVDGVCTLEHLWIEPAWMRRGLGTALFRAAADRARELGATALEWEAEPNAAGFYAKMGGRPRRQVMSAWGRPLSVLGIDL